MIYKNLNAYALPLEGQFMRRLKRNTDSFLKLSATSIIAFYVIPPLLKAVSTL